MKKHRKLTSSRSFNHFKAPDLASVSTESSVELPIFANANQKTQVVVESNPKMTSTFSQVSLLQPQSSNEKCTNEDRSQYYYKDFEAKHLIKQSLDFAQRLVEEKSQLEEHRVYLIEKLENVEKKLQEQMTLNNKLRLDDEIKISNLESNTHYHKMEVATLSEICSDLRKQNQTLLKEKNQLVADCESHKNQLVSVNTNHQKELADLRLQLYEKQMKLNRYLMFEDELDNIIVLSAGAKSNKVEEILKNYSEWPTSVKRRMEQSLQFAKRILKLEKISSDQKQEIFRLRDRIVNLQQQLDAYENTTNCLDLPVSELLKKLRNQEITISRMTTHREKLEGTLEVVRQRNNSLKEQVKLLKYDLLQSNTQKNSKTSPEKLQVHCPRTKTFGQKKLTFHRPLSFTKLKGQYLETQ